MRVSRAARARARGNTLVGFGELAAAAAEPASRSSSPAGHRSVAADPDAAGD
jgi:hypothetical protein